MATTPSQVNVISGAQFASRIADLFPRGWAGDDSKQHGGNVYSMLLSIGLQLSFVQAEVRYALDAQRLQTEQFPELDFASIDFFGDALPRLSGMSNAAFVEAIRATLFRPAATRPALQNALTDLTGFVPRMLEPWSVRDTGHWGGDAYWNVDTTRNPARWGAPGERYQGFIETAPPSIPAIGPNNPIPCWGTVSYWNVPGYLFGILAPVNLNAINDLVNNLRAYGTIVWVKLVAPTSLDVVLVPGPVRSLVATPTGTASVLLSWDDPTTGTPPFQFTVLYRQSGTPDFLPGPVVYSDSASVTNLAAGTAHDFQVIARNQAGGTPSPIVTGSTASVPPSPAENLVATLVQAHAITVTWTQPTSGTPPFNYTVQYRISGTTIWQSLAVGRGALAITIINLVPNTTYEVEVVTSNV